MKNILVLLILVAVAVGCQSETKNIEAYYYPIANLKDGLAYEYLPTASTQMLEFYWYLRTIEQEEQTYLTGMYYDHNFTPSQFSREEKVSNGMLLSELFLYETDTAGYQYKTLVDVQANNAFPFQVKDSMGIFLYKVQWTSPIDSSEITIIRNRRFLKDTTYQYQQKMMKAIVFELREIVESDKDGVLTLEFKGKEIYAKGIGLVYTEKKDVNGDFQQAFYLNDRYPMTVLEEKFKNR